MTLGGLWLPRSECPRGHPAAPELEQIEAELLEDAHLRAFAEFYSDEFASLAGYCRGLTGSEEAAHDIAQEALIRVFSRWISVRRPRAYAYLVATNLAKYSWKRRTAETRAHQRSEADARHARASHNDPAESDKAWLRDLVEDLPDRYRVPVLLYYYADVPVGEISRVLRVPAGSVKRRLHEARALLARRAGERQ